jgi:Ribbon-helix-helix protein, copG family
MRTTVRLPDELMRQARQRAMATGRTLTRLIEDAIRAELSQPTSTGEDHVAYVVEPIDGNGLRPGVDLDDSAGLLDIMEER